MARRSPSQRGGLAVLAAFVLAPGTALGADAVANFNQDASGLSVALQRLGQTTGAQLLYAPELTANQRAPALHGRMSVDRALDVLLAEADLAFRRTPSGVIIIYRAKSAGRAQRRVQKRRAHAPSRRSSRSSDWRRWSSPRASASRPWARSDASVQALSSHDDGPGRRAGFRRSDAACADPDDHQDDPARQQQHQRPGRGHLFLFDRHRTQRGRGGR